MPVPPSAVILISAARLPVAEKLSSPPLALRTRFSDVPMSIANGAGLRRSNRTRVPLAVAVNCSRPLPPLTSTVSVPAAPSLRSVSSPGFQIMRSLPLWPNAWSSASPPVSVSLSLPPNSRSKPPLPSSVSLPLSPNSWSFPEPAVRTSFPVPPNSCAAGRAPLTSLMVRVSSLPRPNTLISAVLATVGVPPTTAIAPPLTRIVPAALRLTAMLFAAESPVTLSVPLLNVAVVAALAGTVVAARIPAASTPPASSRRVICRVWCWVTPLGRRFGREIPESLEAAVLTRTGAARSLGRTMRSPTLAIEANGLVKTFGETRAVDGVDLAVRSGSVYGVLGPNGAGKTTTIKMLTTLLQPDAGTAQVLGHDVVRDADAVRGAVSLTGQLASVDEDLTGRENLILIGRLLGLGRGGAKARAAELLEAFGLADAAAKLVKHYSGGMRRRLDIAASIVVTPELLFLDEPTTGLDPRSRNQVWDIIRALVSEGTTILLCTQYLEEADQLAEGIAVIDHGRVIAEGTPAQLKASVGSGALHIRLLDPEQRPDAERVLGQALDAVHREADPAALSAPCADADRAAGAVAELSRAGIRVGSFSLAQPSLDEVFLALTGHLAEEEAVEEEAAA